MTKDEILQVFRDLAKSQGFYGRLLRDITEDGLQYLEDQHFTDIIDLILFIEC